MSDTPNNTPPVAPSTPPNAPAAPINPAPKKPTNIVQLLVMVCGVLLLIALGIAAFAYVTFSGIQPGADVSKDAGFLNLLVTAVHLGFAVLAFGVFVIVMLFLVKMLLAKKDEEEKKKKAKKGLIFAGIGLAVVLAGWITCFVYFEGKSTELKLNVTYPPIVTDPVDTTRLSAPITIKFDATHAPINQEQFKVLSYDWDFGDKKTGGGLIATHDYTRKGNYDVVLTITEMDKVSGAETKAEFTKKVTIETQSLTAEIIALPEGGAVPLKVTFDGSSSVDPESKIANYEWDVNGDGQFEKEFDSKPKIEYTYDKVGTYTVTLRVTSLTGKFGTITKDITVNASDSPESKIEIQDNPTTFEKGVSYIFKGGSSTSPNGMIVSYEWNFGDSTANETAKTVNHKFAAEGDYKVSLTVTDDQGKTGSSVMEVLIGTKPGVPQAAITTNPAPKSGSLVVEGEAPFLLQFDASSSKDSDNNIVDYRWDFETDGTVDAYGKTSQHLFAKDGIYKVTLTVEDAKQNTNSVSIGVKVLPPGLRAVLNADPVSGEVPLTINFDASGSYYPNGTISTYKWNFGDGTAEILGAAKISHKYGNVGQYVATVTVIGTDNTQTSTSVNVVVRAIQLSACFKASTMSGKAPLSVTFEPDCSVGSISSYSWNFGDGGNSTEVKPTHEFKNPGLYTVKLEVLDNNSTVSNSTVQVEVKP